ncbi:Hypothetical Protein FCC1311_106862 [Hondaea fermentalgiana]|uniref:Uncharacterized protein n=1 Tax=Hondaea fermentalgiana TaxID=2315210 RepID=A0A2R5GUC4_9STRA|nr:Hypothetical Protein FCC1311_106862 [Hondaea fermentalgiana]|eukprot:GBG34462.1 Hypothetical Protein FCC1311_106862 [Hondaea fermentalgiana]
MTESGQDALIAETTGGISAGASVAVSISKLATKNPDAEVTGEVIGRTKDSPNEECWDVDFHNVAPRTQSIPLGDLILKTSRRLSVGVYDPQGKIWARPRFGYRDMDTFLMHDGADTDHSANGPVPLQIQAATCCASGIIMRVELGTKALNHSSNETFRQTQRLVRPWREKRTLHAQGAVVSLSNATRLWSEDGMYFMGSRPATNAEHIADKDDEGALAICASLEALPLALRGETAMYRTKALLHDVDVLATGWKSPSGKIYSTLSTCGSTAAGKAVAVPASVWTDEKNASDLTEISRDSITAEHLDSIDVMRKHDQVRAEIAAFERAFPIRCWRSRLFGSLLGMNVVDAYRAHQLESAAPSSFDNFVSQLIEALLTGRPEVGEPADVMMDPRETLDKAANAGLVPHDQANAASTHVIKGMTQFNREAKIWKQANPKLRCSECKARNRTAAVKTCNFCLTCSLARKGDAPQWISDHVVRLCKDCIPLHYLDGGGSSTLPP